MQVRWIFGTLFSVAFVLSAHAQDEPSDGPQVITLESLSEFAQWDFDAPIQTVTVDEGLYAMFGPGGNIAVSIGEDGVMMVDDQFPEVIPKVNDAIAELGGGAVDFVINTHWHFDHADGNKALGPAGSWLVSHEHSAEMMAKDNDINLSAFIYKQEAYEPDALPVISFKDRMTFHFNGGDIELIHFGPAHTAGDAVIIFRKHNAVHFGDVFNNSGFPFIDADNGGSIDGMIHFCQSVLAEIDEDTTIIPGHGEITDVAAVEAYIEMLTTVRDRVRDLMDEGKTVEEIQAANVTADFAESYGAATMALGFIDRVYASLSK